jgi:His-Xaa-Ser system protein HxsD
MAQAVIESLDAKTSTLTLSLDSDLYPRDALYAAAYVFLDRAYLLLDRNDDRFIVHIRGKEPLDEPTLRAMAGELENELLAQTLRLRVVKANQRIIESVTTLAIAGAAGGMHDGDAANDTYDDHQQHDDSTEFLDDALGISKPWEPKKEEV